MVEKYTKTLETTLFRIKDKIGKTHNLGDLFAIEFIRIFRPDIYKEMNSNHSEFLRKITSKNYVDFYKEKKFEEGLLNFVFKESINFSGGGVEIPYINLPGKIDGKIENGKIESLLSYTSIIPYGNSKYVNFEDILDIKKHLEKGESILSWFSVRGKTLDSFRNELQNYLNKGGEISIFIKPLIEYGEILGYENNSRAKTYSIISNPVLSFLTAYYSIRSRAKPDFIDLVDSDSIAILTYFLASYNKDDQTTNMYKLSRDEWEKVGDKLHTKLKNEWSKILFLENEDFVTTLVGWKELISETQFDELQQIIEDEFTILNKCDSDYFQKDKFIKMLQKFAYRGQIYNIEKAEKKRISDFSYRAYQRLNKFVSWDKIKEIIEKHDLYSEAEICKDFIDGWDNREVDPFKKGWN